MRGALTLIATIAIAAITVGARPYDSPSADETPRRRGDQCFRKAPLPSSSSSQASSHIDTATSSSSPSSTSSAGLSTPPKDCRCGYKLSAFNNAYFPKQYTQTFSTLKDGPGDQLHESGWRITNGEKIGGGGPNGQRCGGKTSNVKIQEGLLQLTVPASSGSDLPGAEIAYDTPVVGGVFTMEAKMSHVAGTCQSMFTYHQGSGVGDEQDIEVLGQSLMKTSDSGLDPGIWLTNWDPASADSSKRVHERSDFPSDPSTDFHNYTIAWLPDKTSYYYDGKSLKSPSQYYSVNPSKVIINHWTNGDPMWSAGPPTQEAVLQVKSVSFYYLPVGGQSPPDGCTTGDACVV